MQNDEGKRRHKVLKKWWDYHKIKSRKFTKGIYVGIWLISYSNKKNPFTENLRLQIDSIF